MIIVKFLLNLCKKQCQSLILCAVLCTMGASVSYASLCDIRDSGECMVDADVSVARDPFIPNSPIEADCRRLGYVHQGAQPNGTTWPMFARIGNINNTSLWQCESCKQNGEILFDSNGYTRWNCYMKCQNASIAEKKSNVTYVPISSDITVNNLPHCYYDSHGVQVCSENVGNEVTNVYREQFMISQGDCDDAHGKGTTRFEWITLNVCGRCSTVPEPEKCDYLSVNYPDSGCKYRCGEGTGIPYAMVDGTPCCQADEWVDMKYISTQRGDTGYHKGSWHLSYGCYYVPETYRYSDGTQTSGELTAADGDTCRIELPMPTNLCTTGCKWNNHTKSYRNDKNPCKCVPTKCPGSSTNSCSESTSKSVSTCYRCRTAEPYTVSAYSESAYNGNCGSYHVCEDRYSQDNRCNVSSDSKWKSDCPKSKGGSTEGQYLYTGTYSTDCGHTCYQCRQPHTYCEGSGERLNYTSCPVSQGGSTEGQYLYSLGGKTESGSQCYVCDAPSQECGGGKKNSASDCYPNDYVEDGKTESGTQCYRCLSNEETCHNHNYLYTMDEVNSTCDRTKDGSDRPVYEIKNIGSLTCYSCGTLDDDCGSQVRSESECEYGVESNGKKTEAGTQCLICKTKSDKCPTGMTKNTSDCTNNNKNYERAKDSDGNLVQTEAGSACYVCVDKAGCGSANKGTPPNNVGYTSWTAENGDNCYVAKTCESPYSTAVQKQKDCPACYTFEKASSGVLMSGMSYCTRCIAPSTSCSTGQEWSNTECKCINSSCPNGYSTTYQSKADCPGSTSGNYTYSSNGKSGDKNCGRCTCELSCSAGYELNASTCQCIASSCPNGYSTSYQSKSDCPGGTSGNYTFTSNGSSGGKVCGKCTCELSSCSEGYSLDQSACQCNTVACASGYSTAYQSKADCPDGNNGNYVYSYNGKSGDKKCGKCTCGLTSSSCQAGYQFNSASCRCDTCTVENGYVGDNPGGCYDTKVFCNKTYYKTKTCGCSNGYSKSQPTSGCYDTETLADGSKCFKSATCCSDSSYTFSASKLSPENGYDIVNAHNNQGYCIKAKTTCPNNELKTCTPVKSATASPCYECVETGNHYGSNACYTRNSKANSCPPNETTDPSGCAYGYRKTNTVTACGYQCYMCNDCTTTCTSSAYPYTLNGSCSSGSCVKSEIRTKSCTDQCNSNVKRYACDNATYDSSTRQCETCIASSGYYYTDGGKSCSGNTRIWYEKSGSCYVKKTETCENGCENGECSSCKKLADCSAYNLKPGDLDDSTGVAWCDDGCGSGTVGRCKTEEGYYYGNRICSKSCTPTADCSAYTLKSGDLDDSTGVAWCNDGCGSGDLGRCKTEEGYSYSNRKCVKAPAPTPTPTPDPTPTGCTPTKDCSSYPYTSSAFSSWDNVGSCDDGCNGAKYKCTSGSYDSATRSCKSGPTPCTPTNSCSGYSEPEAFNSFDNTESCDDGCGYKKYKCVSDATYSKYHKCMVCPAGRSWIDNLNQCTCSSGEEYSKTGALNCTKDHTTVCQAMIGGTCTAWHYVEVVSGSGCYACQKYTYTKK